MIKKGIIVLLCLFVLALGISYHHTQVRQRAVQAGRWILYRFNLLKSLKNKFT